MRSFVQCIFIMVFSAEFKVASISHIPRAFTVRKPILITAQVITIYSQDAEMKSYGYE